MTVNRTTTKVLAGVVMLLLGTGLLHRWAHLSRARAASTYRPLSAPLSDVPSRLGPYILSRDLSLTSEILRAARVDSFVYREYTDPAAEQPVQLYVGYWGHQNVGVGHGPEVCFPSAGWEPEGVAAERMVRFSMPDGTAMEVLVAIHHFARTEPEGTVRMAVGFVAVVEGVFRASSRGVFLHRPPSAADEGFLAHIEVSIPVIRNSWEAADSRIVSFMEVLLPCVSECLFGAEVR